MHKSFFNYKQSNINRLKKLKTNKPRDFWKLLKSKNRTKCNARLKDLFEYFRSVNNNEDNDDTLNNDNDTNDINEQLNIPITIDELEKAVKRLKNNKSNGVDDIVNEHIKMSINSTKHIFVKLFNIIFESGIIPNAWTIRVIHPIFKNKGDSTDPLNYRPITLLSCLGKLFTAILNIRLEKYASDNNIINDYQSGFRKGFSTVDTLF